MKSEYRHRNSKNGRTLKIVFYHLWNENGRFEDRAGINHAFLKKLLKKAGYKKVVRK